MSRRPARFTQADVARAIKAVEQTGARMAVEIGPDGTIRIVPIDILERLLPAHRGKVEAEREIVL